MLHFDGTLSVAAAGEACNTARADVAYHADAPAAPRLPPNACSTAVLCSTATQATQPAAALTVQPDAHDPQSARPFTTFIECSPTAYPRLRGTTLAANPSDHQTKAHGALGVAQSYSCGYCGNQRTSASADSSGRVRIRCDCGGVRGDRTSRTHANWVPLSGGKKNPNQVQTFTSSPPMSTSPLVYCTQTGPWSSTLTGAESQVQQADQLPDSHTRAVSNQHTAKDASCIQHEHDTKSEDHSASLLFFASQVKAPLVSDSSSDSHTNKPAIDLGEAYSFVARQPDVLNRVVKKPDVSIMLSSHVVKQPDAINSQSYSIPAYSTVSIEQPMLLQTSSDLSDENYEDC